MIHSCFACSWFSLATYSLNILQEVLELLMLRYVLVTGCSIEAAPSRVLVFEVTLFLFYPVFFTCPFSLVPPNV